MPSTTLTADGPSSAISVPAGGRVLAVWASGTGKVRIESGDGTDWVPERENVPLDGYIGSASAACQMRLFGENMAAGSSITLSTP